MKLWEISSLMREDKLFKVSDTESVDMETGEIFNQEYLDNLPMEQEEKSRNVGLVIKDTVSDIEKVKAEIDRLTKMKKRLENRVNSLKSYVLQYGCPVNTIEVTIKFSKGRESVEVDKGLDLPEQYRKVTWTPNKTEIGKALKAGEEIPGCRIARKPTVTVK